MMGQIINGHHGDLAETGWSLSDMYVCSCGWESSRYWDGVDLAFDEWKKHAEAATQAAVQQIEGVGL